MTDEVVKAGHLWLDPLIFWQSCFNWISMGLGLNGPRSADVTHTFVATLRQKRQGPASAIVCHYCLTVNQIKFSVLRMFIRLKSMLPNIQLSRSNYTSSNGPVLLK
jgi:hypothetical protein